VSPILRDGTSESPPVDELSETSPDVWTSRGASGAPISDIGVVARGIPHARTQRARGALIKEMGILYVTCGRAYESQGVESGSNVFLSVVLESPTPLGANGFGRPTGSGMICVPKSRNAPKAGSENIVPDRETARSVKSVSTIPISAMDSVPDTEVVVSNAPFGLSPENMYHRPIKRAIPTATTNRVLREKRDVILL